jgi:hypothetical protein
LNQRSKPLSDSGFVPMLGPSIAPQIAQSPLTGSRQAKEPIEESFQLIRNVLLGLPVLVIWSEHGLSWH